MTDHPLRPVKDQRLGEPLPHQLPNLTQARQTAVYTFPETNRCLHVLHNVVVHAHYVNLPIQEIQSNEKDLRRVIWYSLNQHRISKKYS